MQNLKITIIGNSVALRIRPPKKSPENINYSRFLENLLLKEFNNKHITINNKAVGAFTIINVINTLDEFIQTFPDYFIINLGVVDSSTREVPLWFYRIATRNLNKPINKFFHLIYRGIIIKMRPFFVKARGRNSWISKKNFRKYYSFLVETLLKETNAQLILLPINLADKRVEQELPGTRKKHEEFNKIIEDIAKKNKQFFINLNLYLKPELYPDGIHFSYEGHQLVAKKVSDLIINDVNKRLL